MSLGNMRLTPQGLFRLLMLGSIAALFAPPSWTNALKGVSQLLVPTEDLLFSAAHKAARIAESGHSQAQTSGNDIAGMTAQLVTQEAQIQQIAEENARLRQLRTDHELPDLPLLPAKIVALDMVEWRDSALVARGSSRAVRYHDWVASRIFIDQGMASGLAENQPVLARECLIGRVEQVSPYMSRVQLFSDIDAPRIEVRLARPSENAKTRILDFPCSLRGVGRGQMVIEKVSYQYINAASSQPMREGEAPAEPSGIMVGDLVLTAPGQLGLPSPMVVGKVTSLEENHVERLTWTIHVHSLADPTKLREVYMIPLVPIELQPIQD
jgi:cell shape-determining protein MreC